jgi:8-amino-7-oxononanoate synthase
MTDAVFSMDGDIADVQTLAGLCQATSSWLMIDDAHGFGVLGEQGAGLCQALKLSQQEVPILMATLGKAVGVSGAFVAGSEDLIETLIQQARSYIFTTASPPANAAAVMQSIDIIRNESWRRDKLQQLISYFRQQMTQQGYRLMPSDTAIQPLVIGDNHRALKLSQQLLEQDILVTAIRPPTVPENTARLRFTLSATHETSDIDHLAATLGKIFKP